MKRVFAFTVLMTIEVLLILLALPGQLMDSGRDAWRDSGLWSRKEWR